MSARLDLGPPSAPTSTSTSQPPSLGTLLLEAGLVGKADVAMALGRGRRLGSTLIAQGRVDADAVAHLLGLQAGVPAARTSDLITPLPEARALVPHALCRALCAVPYQLEHDAGGGQVLLVAMRDPADPIALARLQRAAGMRISPRIAAELVLRAALDDDAALDALSPVAPRGGLRPPRRMPVGTSKQPAAAAALPVIPALPTPAPLKLSGGWALWPQLGRLLIPVVVLSLLAWGAIALRHGLKPTTVAVKASHHSSALRLQVGFPDGAGWRVSTKRGLRERGLRAELYYRGGVPEIPLTAMLLGRVEAESAEAAARRLLGRAVPAPLDDVGCHASDTIPDMVTCRTVGAVMPDNPLQLPRPLEATAFAGNGDYVVALMIDPDRTLSEASYIIESIVVD